MTTRRAGAAAAVTAVMLAANAVVGTAPAQAHVHAVSPGAARGGFAVVAFEVPNESPTGSATTEFSVTLPDVAAARTEAKPGWTARLDRDTAAGTVHAVTWTAAPGAGIAADQFGVFRVSLKLPDADTVQFPAVQRYADGTEVRWDQPPQPGGDEPENPAATLILAAEPAPAAAGSADTPARLLAGLALLTAAIGVTLAITRGRA